MDFFFEPVTPEPSLWPERLTLLVLVCFVAWVVWKVRHPYAIFSIEYRNGNLTAGQGSPPRQFLNELREVLAATTIERCVIRGVKDRGGVRLMFKHVDEPLQQRIRNLWKVYGWR